MTKIIVASTENVINVYIEKAINVAALVTLLLVTSYKVSQKDKVDICFLPAWIIYD